MTSTRGGTKAADIGSPQVLRGLNQPPDTKWRPLWHDEELQSLRSLCRPLVVKEDWWQEHDILPPFSRHIPDTLGVSIPLLPFLLLTNRRRSHNKSCEIKRVRTSGGLNLFTMVSTNAGKLFSTGSPLSAKTTPQPKASPLNCISIPATMSA